MRQKKRKKVNDILQDYGNRISVPSKCVEELIHLQQSKKIETNQLETSKDIILIIEELGFDIKYVSKEYLLTLAELPLFSDHKDPTDRIIVAQAITEKIPIISSDRKFPLYEWYGLNLVFNKR